MVSPPAVDRARHGVARQPTGHRFLLHPRADRECRIEWRLGGTVAHVLDGPEQAAAADVSDMVMIGEPLLQPSLQALTLLPDILEQIFTLDRLLHGQGCCAGDGVPHVGMAVLEKAAAVAERRIYVCRQHNGADRLITGAEAFGDGDQIGRNALLLASVQSPGTAHSAHHLVENEQNAVTTADLPYLPEVSRWRRGAALRRAPDRLGNEADDSVGAQL